LADDPSTKGLEIQIAGPNAGRSVFELNRHRWLNRSDGFHFFNFLEFPRLANAGQRFLGGFERARPDFCCG
jgi:frataxin-like iron-binding protein CyaY